MLGKESFSLYKKSLLFLWSLRCTDLLSLRQDCDKSILSLIYSTGPGCKSLARGTLHTQRAREKNRIGNFTKGTLSLAFGLLLLYRQHSPGAGEQEVSVFTNRYFSRKHREEFKCAYGPRAHLCECRLRRGGIIETEKG